MLHLWYSEQCTREIKLITSVLTCAVIYYCSTFEKLDPAWPLICLSVGVITHLLTMLSLKISEQNPYAQGFKILSTLAPIFALITIIYLLPSPNKLYTTVQAIGFTALGLFVISIYQNRAKRFK